MKFFKNKYCNEFPVQEIKIILSIKIFYSFVRLHIIYVAIKSVRDKKIDVKCNQFLKKN